MWYPRELILAALTRNICLTQEPRALGCRDNTSGWNSDIGQLVKKFYTWFVLILIYFWFSLSNEDFPRNKQMNKKTITSGGRAERVRGKNSSIHAGWVLGALLHPPLLDLLITATSLICPHAKSSFKLAHLSAYCYLPTSFKSMSKCP